MDPTENQTKTVRRKGPGTPPLNRVKDYGLESQFGEARCSLLHKSLAHWASVSPLTLDCGKPQMYLNLRGLSGVDFNKGQGPSQSLLSSKSSRILQESMSPLVTLLPCWEG